MAVTVQVSGAGTELLPAEIEIVGGLARAQGRVTLLVESYAAAEVCRRNLADAGVGTSVDVLTPAAWLEGLWRLMGDGTRLVTAAERLILSAHVLGSRAGGDGDAAQLKDNPGSIRMLADMARICLPFANEAGRKPGLGLSHAERRSLAALAAYEAALDERGLCEPAVAAMRLASSLRAASVPCARAVVVRSLPDMPEYLLRLLEAVAHGGELVLLLSGYARSFAEELAARFGARVGELPGEEPAVPPFSCVEVSGPTARAATYARMVARELETSQRIAIAAPQSLELYRALSGRLAARGILATVEASVPFAETRAGGMFFTLIDFLDRLNTQEASAWWPAPEVVDWLRSPFSGTGASPFTALSLDTVMRKTRAMDKKRLFAELDSRQSRELNRERTAAERQGRVSRPIVFKAVIDALDAGAYARALTFMRDACAAAGPSLFGEEGLAAQQVELVALQRALDMMERARQLGVRPERALVALQKLSVPVAMESQVDGRSCGQDSAVPAVRIMGLEGLAAHEAGAFDAALLLDMGAGDYPLTERETVSTVLAAKLGCSGVRLAPAMRQRERVTRALQAARRSGALAYVAHNDAAEELYPAVAFTEFKTAAHAAGKLCDAIEAPGEGALFANLDPAQGMGACVDDAPRTPEHVLPHELTPYVFLPQRCLSGHPVPRTLSASQVENYLACPYRWFVNSRVVSRRLDVEFGAIERGNFAHDVMQRFYERLAECGLVRVRPETIEACLEQMDIAFDEVRADHLRGKYTHGKYATEERPRAIRSGLVPLDELERMRIDAMREQFHEVVRHDAHMLGIYEPVRLEYSFDKQHVTYAGRPLGGRIDRIDVAACAGSGKRFVVIDYKTGASVADMASPDPTMQLDEGERLAEGWLPGRDRDRAPKVQTLMYATALERMTGGSAQGAVYYGLRGPAVAGAVARALVESEPPAFPEDKVSAYPGVKGRTRVKHDGTMDFPELLERVERGVATELDALEAGAIAPRPASDSCTFCPLTMCEKRR